MEGKERWACCGERDRGTWGEWESQTEIMRENWGERERVDRDWDRKYKVSERVDRDWEGRVQGDDEENNNRKVMFVMTTTSFKSGYSYIWNVENKSEYYLFCENYKLVKVGSTLCFLDFDVFWSLGTKEVAGPTHRCPHRPFGSLSTPVPSAWSLWAGCLKRNYCEFEWKL